MQSQIPTCQQFVLLLYANTVALKVYSGHVNFQVKGTFLVDLTCFQSQALS